MPMFDHDVAVVKTTMKDQKSEGRLSDGLSSLILVDINKAVYY
jgi:hypothetical protein